MDRFNAMKAFVRVVETGSFTKAAESLEISRTSLTHLIQQLETQLRVSLLNRTTRRVSVTIDGAAYYERVLRLLADLEELEAGLPNAATVPRGRLRVDVPTPLATLILIPALPKFHAQFPDIQLDMGVSDRMADVVGDSVDCVIRGGEMADFSLKARHLCDLQLGVFAAPSYLARCGTPSHPRELTNTHHRIVRYGQQRNSNNSAYEMSCGSDHIEVNGEYVVAIDDGNAYLAAGVAGMGVLWLPEYMSQSYVASSQLIPLFEAWHVEPMPLYAAYPPNRHVSKKLRVFIDWAADLLADHSGVAHRGFTRQVHS